MKRLVLCFSLLLLSTLFLNAQQTIGEYHSSYFNHTFTVKASYSDADELAVYIQIAANGSSDANFSIRGVDKLNAFISTLKEVKSKYVEWCDVAKKNNVSDMSKDFDVNFPKVNIAWYSSRWWFAFNQTLHPKFIVFKDGKMAFIIAGLAVSSDNDYINEKYYFALSSAKEFDELISVISPSNIEEKLKKKQDIQDLFK